MNIEVKADWVFVIQHYIQYSLRIFTKTPAQGLLC